MTLKTLRTILWVGAIAYNAHTCANESIDTKFRKLPSYQQTQFLATKTAELSPSMRMWYFPSLSDRLGDEGYRSFSEELQKYRRFRQER